MQYYIIWYDNIQYGTVLNDAGRYDTVLYGSGRYYMVRDGTVLYGTGRCGKGENESYGILKKLGGVLLVLYARLMPWPLAKGDRSTGILTEGCHSFFC